MDKIKYLSRINLFKDLDLEQLESLAPVTPANTVTRKTIVASPHMPQKRLFFVKSGMVRLYRISKGGKELTVDILGDGHLFGEVGSFTTGSENLYAETIVDSIICTIDKNQFETIITAKPELGLRLIELVSLRLKEIEEMLELMAYGSVRKRLLYLLHKLCQKFGNEQAIHDEKESREGWVQLEIKLTHQELASMAGSIRETVTEQLKDFVAEGMIRKASLRNPLLVRPDRILTALENCD
ncbi:Crp/Fnr family transcriptional regulator [Brevibacillus humidisoli]|uniref:Crp/Fnr family transcriptional regulator n=1 Tax=Brevibacillus humidisoli TaxID=2895522 RepID=UPI001E39E798|nr:Crp/Fnr family transcriptional regulator [Brevibacillus humidisoli]UFJ39547.1 Crp/Fnr family transcriptional regulator [Brevibacillus humidisoli]